MWSTSAVSVSFGWNTRLVSATRVVSLGRHTLRGTDTVAVGFGGLAFLESGCVAELVALSRNALVRTSAVVVVEGWNAGRLAEVVAGDWCALRSAEAELVQRCWDALSDAHIVHLMVVAFRSADTVSVFF